MAGMTVADGSWWATVREAAGSIPVPAPFPGAPVPLPGLPDVTDDVAKLPGKVAGKVADATGLGGLGALVGNLNDAGTWLRVVQVVGGLVAVVLGAILIEKDVVAGVTGAGKAAAVGAAARAASLV